MRMAARPTSLAGAYVKNSLILILDSLFSSVKICHVHDYNAEKCIVIILKGMRRRSVQRDLETTIIATC